MAVRDEDCDCFNIVLDSIVFALQYNWCETSQDIFYLRNSLLQTAVQAFTIGVVVSYYNTNVVLQALGLTFATVTGLTVYTLNTKRDFSFIGYG